MEEDFVSDGEILEGELLHAKVPVTSASTDPSDVLKFTQGLRYRIVDDLLGEDRRIPADIKDLTGVLRDMDKAALTTRELDIAESDSTDGRLVIDTFRQLKAMMGQDADNRPVKPRTRSPLDVNALPQVSFIEGEDAQGENILNISNFVTPDE